MPKRSKAGRVRRAGNAEGPLRQLNVAISADLYDKLAVLSDASHIAKRHLVEEAIEGWLDRRHDEDKGMKND